MINEMAFRARQKLVLQSNFDAGEAMFLERELTQLRVKLFEVQFPPSVARTFAPKATDIASSAETYAYKVYEPVGRAKLIAYKGGDIPRVDVIAKEVLGKVRPIGAGYGWDINELREAARMGTQLPEVKARTARDVIERGIDQILAFGSLPDETGALPDIGLNGMLNNALVEAIGIMVGTYWVNQMTGAPGSATVANILSDLSVLASTVSTFSSNVWNVDTILLPTREYAFIQQTPYSALTGESILSVFKRNNPQITTIAPWYKLNLANDAGTGPRAVAYMKDPMILESVIPQEFEVMPPEMKGFEFLHNCHARCGGVKIYQPLAMRYMDIAIV